MQSALAYQSTRPGLTGSIGIEGTITTNKTANQYTCTFTRDIDVTKTTKDRQGADYTRSFDLVEGEKWVILMAKGKMDANGMTQYHGFSGGGPGNTAIYRTGFELCQSLGPFKVLSEFMHMESLAQ